MCAISSFNVFCFLFEFGLFSLSIETNVCVNFERENESFVKAIKTGKYFQQYFLFKNLYSSLQYFISRLKICPVLKKVLIMNKMKKKNIWWSFQHLKDEYFKPTQNYHNTINWYGIRLVRGSRGFPSANFFSSCLAFSLEIFRTIRVFSYFDWRNELCTRESVFFFNARQFVLIFLRKVLAVSLRD